MLSYKIIIVGQPGVGKTSILRRLTKNAFDQNTRATRGVDHSIYDITLRDGKTVRLQLWDVAGQERYGEMTSIFYRDSHGVVIVHDASNDKQFDLIKSWKEDVDKKVNLVIDGIERPLPALLLINKIDLVNLEKINERREQIDSYCALNGYSAWYDTSAKNDINIREAFLCIAEYVDDIVVPRKKDEEVIDIESTPRPVEKDRCSC